MIRSSLVKSACVAIALLGFSAPQAGAIELQGSNPSAQLNEGMISKAYIAHRGVTAVGPRGGVYHRGGTAVGGYRRRRLSRRRGLSRRYGGSTAEDMAAGRGPAGITGVRAARSRPALRSACSLRGLQRSTQARRPRRDCAGTTPTQAIGRDSGTPANKPRTMGPAEASVLRPPRLGEAVSNYRDGRSRRALSVSYRNHPYSQSFAATGLPASYSSTASPMVAKKDSSPI